MSHDELRNYVEFYSILTVAEIVRRFSNGQGKTSSKIDHLKDAGIPSELLGEILNRLSEKELIVYTEDKEYVPARKPSNITIREVIEAVSNPRMLAPEDADDAVSRQLREAFKKVSSGVDKTLEGLNIEMLVSGRNE